MIFSRISQIFSEVDQSSTIFLAAAQEAEVSEDDPVEHLDQIYELR